MQIKSPIMGKNIHKEVRIGATGASKKRNKTAKKREATPNKRRLFF